MAGLIMEYETKAGRLVEIDGTVIKYWSGLGLPDYIGSTQDDGFKEAFPDVYAELLRRKIIRELK